MESLNLNLTIRIYLFLVLCGLKPATYINTRSFGFNYDRDDFEKLLNDLDLFFDYNENGPTLNEKYCGFFISVQKENVRELKLCFQNDQRKMGELFGYPKTAIDAFLGLRPRLNDNIRNKFLKNSSLRKLSLFIFSDEYYKEEMRSTTIVWYKKIRVLSPKMFLEILESGMNNKKTES